MLDLDDATARTLRYTAARFMLGVLPAVDMKLTVEALMATGLWDDTFLDVIETTATLRDMSAPFKACLAALSLLPSTRDEAVRRVTAHHLIRIVEGSIDPCDGLYTLFKDDLIYDYDAFDRPAADPATAPTLRWLHEECHHVEMAHYTRESADPLPPIRAEHHDRIIATARQWLAANAHEHI